MQKRTINNIDFVRVRNPQGSGYLYYAEAGPGGNVLAWDSGEISQGTMYALAGWDTEPFEDAAPPTPTKHLDWPGFR